MSFNFFLRICYFAIITGIINVDIIITIVMNIIITINISISILITTIFDPNVRQSKHENKLSAPNTWLQFEFAHPPSATNSYN